MSCNDSENRSSLVLFTVAPRKHGKLLRYGRAHVTSMLILDDSKVEEALDGCGELVGATWLEVDLPAVRAYPSLDARQLYFDAFPFELPFD